MSATHVLRRALTRTIFAVLALGLLALAPAVAEATVTQTVGGCSSATETAPANAVSAQVTLLGAAGGNASSGGVGGDGADLVINMPVTGGHSYDVVTGCRGGNGNADSGSYNGNAGSYNSGGGGSGGEGYNGGGTGGGSTYIANGAFVASNAYGIAGGGGGGGASGEVGGYGGQGGGGGAADANGAAGASENDGSETAPGGGGGTSGDNGGAGGARGQFNSGDYGATGGYGSTGSGGYRRRRLVPTTTATSAAGMKALAAGVVAAAAGLAAAAAGPVPPTVTTTVLAVAAAAAVSPTGRAAPRRPAWAPTNAGAGSATIVYTIGAVASLTSTSENFGSLTTGSSQSETFTLTNTSSDTPLQSIGLSAGGAYSIPAAQNNCAGQTLAVNGGSCTFEATFAPTTDGPQNHLIDVTSNAANGTQSVLLTGTGEYPPAISAPASQSFGAVTVERSQNETITVENSGDETLDLSALYIDGSNSDQFSILGDTCSGADVAGGAACQVQVQFIPSTNTAMSATLEIPASNATAQSVVLTGTGQNPPTVSVESAQDFGTVTTGQVQDETITVTNAGDQALNVAQASIAGTNPGQFAIGTGGQLLNANVTRGGTCTVSRLRADQRRRQDGDAEYPSNDPAEPAAVSLTGTGSQPADGQGRILPGLRDRHHRADPG